MILKIQSCNLLLKIGNEKKFEVVLAPFMFIRKYWTKTVGIMINIIWTENKGFLAVTTEPTSHLKVNLRNIVAAKIQMDNKSYKTKAGSSKFRKHIHSSIKQEDIENMTNLLNDELVDSQNAMNQIASVFKSINSFKTNDLAVLNLPSDATETFLESEPLQLVTPDLVGMTFEGEEDQILATMKTYADNLKKNLPHVELQTELNPTVSNFEPLDVNQYALSLDQLGKRLAYIRQNLSQKESQRDLHLENKLEILSKDIKSFKEMTEGNTLFHKCSEDSTQGGSSQVMSQDMTQFEDIINKLLSGINDVTYMRQNIG